MGALDNEQAVRTLENWGRWSRIDGMLKLGYPSPMAVRKAGLFVDDDDAKKAEEILANMQIMYKEHVNLIINKYYLMASDQFIADKMKVSRNTVIKARAIAEAIFWDRVINKNQ